MPRPADVDLEPAKKRPDAWWTVLVVDPVALRVLPWLVPRPAITPDRLSYASLALALVAGAAFLDGRWVLGAVLFEAHFLLDCLDGKLARVRGTSHPRGGFVDLACDLVGTTWCLAALGLAAGRGTSLLGLALVPAVLHVVYTWSTLYRSGVGALERARPRTGLAGRLAARRLTPVPYGVDVEALTLFVLPLTTSAPAVRGGLAGAAAFYAVATARNLRATYRALS